MVGSRAKFVWARHWWTNGTPQGFGVKWPDLIVSNVKVVISGPDRVILWWDVAASSPDVRVERLWLDHLTHVLKKWKIPPFQSILEWDIEWDIDFCVKEEEWEQKKQKRRDCMCFFLGNIQRKKKKVRLHQHVHLRHKLKLCHVLNRCSATQRILCLWHGCTDRMKHAESGIQV